jgi:hypothetical protein
MVASSELVTHRRNLMVRREAVVQDAEQSWRPACGQRAVPEEIEKWQRNGKLYEQVST